MKEFKIYPYGQSEKSYFNIIIVNRHKELEQQMDKISKIYNIKLKSFQSGPFIAVTITYYTPKAPYKFGEIIFIKRFLTAPVMAHESTHAAVALMRPSRLKKLYKNATIEESFCILQERIFSLLYKRLKWALQ